MTNVTTANSVQALIPTSLAQRVQELGLPLLSIDADGAVRAESVHERLHRAIVQAPAFAAAVRDRLDEVRAAIDQPCAVWPGVWLLALVPARRRRSSRAEAQAFAATLFVDAAFTEADQFRLVCDQQQLDATAFAASLSAAALTHATERDRLVKLLQWCAQDAIQAERRSTEIQSLSQQLSESYEEISLLYRLSTTMTVDVPPATFLTDACLELQQVVGLKWMALQLVDSDPRLNELAGQVFAAGATDCDTQTLRRGAHEWILHPAAAPKPMIIDHAGTLGIAHLVKLATNILIVPLMREDRLIGVLFGGDKLDGDAISSIDSKLCNSFAGSLSIFLDNTMLYDDMQAMFLGTLHALTASIDAKDSYTHGHSERVALMSRQLAIAAGLSDDLVERVYIAGVVHDVGKIGVPEAVLTKAGRLTDEEFELIKAHPEIGARILSDIRQMKDLIPGVLYHHERWDGRGYPHQLAGTDIPLFGRLICLADSFDAMSSNRTYRKAMALDQVLEEIRRCAGSQFDPELAALFVDLDFTPFHELIAQHQQMSEQVDARRRSA